MFGQHVRLFLFAGWGLHGDATSARYDVHMQVEDHLTSGALIELLDRDAVSRKSLDSRLCDLLRDHHYMREVACSDVENVACRCLRQHKGMPGGAGHNVKKRERLVVFVDFIAR